MKKLNTIFLNVVSLFKGLRETTSRYVPDDKIPDTHIELYDADDELFSASDDRFMVMN